MVFQIYSNYLATVCKLFHVIHFCDIAAVNLESFMIYTFST